MSSGLVSLAGVLVLAAALPSSLVSCRHSPPDERRCLEGDLAACRASCRRGVMGESGCAPLVRRYAEGDRAPRDRLFARALQLQIAREGIDAGSAPGDPVTVDQLDVEGQRMRLACPGLPMPRARLDPTPRAARELIDARLRCDDDARTCARLGQLAFEGRLFVRDPARALGFFEKACAAGDLGACIDAGRAALASAAPDAADRARAGFGRACEEGRQDGCAELASHEAALDLSPERRRALLERACDAGEPAGCRELAYLARDGTKWTLAARSERYVRAAVARCKQKDPRACHDLVLEYGRAGVTIGGGVQGIDVMERLDAEAGAYQAPHGQSAARLWLLDLGCEAGDVEACTEAGNVWAGQAGRDKGGPYFERACETGSQPACIALAAYLGDGDPRSRELLATACAAGFVEGCRLPESASKEALHRACSLGSRQACATIDEVALACVAARTRCQQLAERETQLPATCRVRLAELGCPDRAENCWTVGEGYRRGEGVPADRAKAWQNLLTGCDWLPPYGTERGPVESVDPARCAALAGYVERGEGVDASPERAAWLYAMLCVRGEGHCDDVARIVGKPVQKVPRLTRFDGCSVLPAGSYCSRGRCQRFGIDGATRAWCAPERRR